MLGEAAVITGAGASVLRQALAAGRPARDVAAEVEREVRRRGARHVIVMIGTGPTFVAPPDGRPIRDGDLVTGFVEVAGIDGYWVEQADLYAVGGIDERREALGRATLHALADGAARLRPGLPASASAEAMERRAHDGGFTLEPACGHGVGLDDQDLPKVTARDTGRLIPDMVVALHPQLSSEHAFGASAGATYHITDAGPSRLTSEPQLHRIRT